MQIMQDRLTIGVRILELITCFRDALPTVAQHHEWFDGSGRPEGWWGRTLVCMRAFLRSQIATMLLSPIDPTEKAQHDNYSGS
jgi:hypothetical protein